MISNERKITSPEIKKRELEMLIYFQRFCKKNNLKFYLTGGTLLGAIRHKGFIPWDDDIDVCMPRNDYEKFLTIYQQDDCKYMLRTKKFNNFIAPYSKIVDCNTIIKYRYYDDDMDSQLWIDILPIDGLPESIEEVKKIYRWCRIYRKLFALCAIRLGEGKTFFRKYIKYLIKPIVNLYGQRKASYELEKIALKYSYDNSKFVGAVTWGLYGAAERMLKSEFEKEVLVEFEGNCFPTFSCWDSYLRNLYGDYMKLPPLKDRQTHDMEVYLID
ncbi:LicD family protein [Mitsuokella jalaludinii]|uniref:LicD family protein n=1 Tax=Mitsuokella jalaludinii TaxID=187979 RepID=UPI003F96DFB8